jgi:hypothetical protein
MDIVLRLLLRFLLIPLGYGVAVVAGTLVVLYGSWHVADAATVADPDRRTIMMFGFVFAGPILLFVLLSMMWLPAAVGIVLAEAFALRSWMFHVGNGAVAALLGWNLFGIIDDTGLPLNQPLPVIAAGLAGGFAYWAVAGWSSGFWLPVFAPARARGVS